MFSFSSLVLEGTEAGCGDEHEFLGEREADQEVTEAGDFLSEDLVFCVSDVCALFPLCTARTARWRRSWRRSGPASSPCCSPWPCSLPSSPNPAGRRPWWPTWTPSCLAMLMSRIMSRYIDTRRNSLVF